MSKKERRHGRLVIPRLGEGADNDSVVQGRA